MILAFLAATALPLAATIWNTTSLLDRSLGYATTGELYLLSRTHEAFGQRDEAALASLGAALEFQDSIGRGVIEARVRALVQRLADGLRKIDGVSLWTSVDPIQSAGILVAKPAALEPRRLVSDLYQRDKIVCAAAGGTSSTPS